jgi:hypothetical protein
MAELRFGARIEKAIIPASRSRRWRLADAETAPNFQPSTDWIMPPAMGIEDGTIRFEESDKAMNGEKPGFLGKNFKVKPVGLRKNAANPEVDKKYLRAGNIYPRVSNKCLRVIYNYPRVRDNYPRVGNNYPRVDRIYPRVCGIYPGAGKNYPRSSDNYPRVGGIYPRVDGIYPRVDSIYPRVDGIGP